MPQMTLEVFDHLWDSYLRSISSRWHDTLHTVAPIDQASIFCHIKQSCQILIYALDLYLCPLHHLEETLEMTSQCADIKPCTRIITARIWKLRLVIFQPWYLFMVVLIHPRDCTMCIYRAPGETLFVYQLITAGGRKFFWLDFWRAELENLDHAQHWCRHPTWQEAQNAFLRRGSLPYSAVEEQKMWSHQGHCWGIGESLVILFGESSPHEWSQEVLGFSFSLVA